MYKVNDEQVDFILSDIKARGIVLEDLQYNLLDHMCCIIENEMPADADFTSFYKKILPRFFKKELNEIQEETDNLLTFKHYFAMKKTLKISGLSSSIILLLGAIFKVMHWPGAGAMLFFGTLVFSLIFMPLMIILKFKDEERTTDKIVLSLGFLLGIAGMMGFLFKIMHWPFANVLMIGGIGSFVFAYVPLYFFTRIRRPEMRFNTIVNSALMMAMGGMLFAMINLSQSKNLHDTIVKSQVNLATQQADLKQTNDSLYLLVSANADAKVLYQSTATLIDYLDSVKVYLLMQYGNLARNEAVMVNHENLAYPNDHNLIKEFFTENEGQYGYQDFLAQVDKYNQSLIRLGMVSSLIHLENFDFIHTNTGILLTDFNQLKYQVAITEYGHLMRLSDN